MSILLSVFLIKTEKSREALGKCFRTIEPILGSEWLACNQGDDMPNGMFSPGEYITRELSRTFGEAMFVGEDSRNDQMEYEHSRNGEILRKLSWLSDGCQSTWTCIEGEPEPWEGMVVFSERTFDDTIRFLQYDDAIAKLPPDQFQAKVQEIRKIWERRSYALNGQIPHGNSFMGTAALTAMGLSLPRKPY